MGLQNHVYETGVIGIKSSGKYFFQRQHTGAMATGLGQAAHQTGSRNSEVCESLPHGMTCEGMKGSWRVAETCHCEAVSETLQRTRRPLLKVQLKL